MRVIQRTNTKRGERKGGINWEIRIDIYTLLILYIKQITNENLQYSRDKEIQKRGAKCIRTADSHW